ncbi:MAG TPA: CocE/NonD family hydrolase [Acidimicrobiia bacterium]
MTEIREYVAMEDGVRLAISRFEPQGRDGPWPVIVEALPYRKDDLTASYRAEYRRLVDEGRYVIVRVDVRGTGSSEGVATDEYPVQEQRDLVRLIAWCAAQPWSTGRVGMYGTSYSGFNSLQVAIERPPELGAICAIYATDDRYTDDSHYAGGVLRAIDLVDYVAYMVAMNALPPVPAVFGDGWRDEWRRRLDATEPWLLRWLEEQTDGPYWRHGSLRLDSRPGTVSGYDRIECATMLVAGWADGYRNNTLRTFAALQCEKRLLLGPWSHMATATSLPGPHIDLVPELIRFFDRHLRAGGATGAVTASEPPIAVFVRRATRPEPDLAEHAGAWRFEDEWPPARAKTRVLSPGGDGDDLVPVRGDVGTSAWNSCAASLPWGQPQDQRADDAWSLVYDWPVAEELEILGNGTLRVTVTASAPVAFLSVKLCDVFPDGMSALVTRGFLNLTHRHSSVEPEALVPGEPVDVEVELEATSWVFEPGHRLRIALAGTDWPNTWPPPAPVTLHVDRTSVRLALPELPPLTDLRPVPAFVAPQPGSWHPGEPADEPQPALLWQIAHDVLGRRTEATVRYGSRYEGELASRVTELYEGDVSVSTVDPGDADARATSRFEIAWPDAACACIVESRLLVRSDADTYHVEVELDVDDGGEPFARRRWNRDIPRTLQ